MRADLPRCLAYTELETFSIFGVVLNEADDVAASLASRNRNPIDALRRLDKLEIDMLLDNSWNLYFDGRV